MEKSLDFRESYTVFYMSRNDSKEIDVDKQDVTVDELNDGALHRDVVNKSGHISHRSE